MTSQFFQMLMAQPVASVGTPLNYGGGLRLFLDAENDVTLSGDNVTQWDDQDVGTVFTVPGGGRSPEFESNAQNGLPGINFQQPIGQGFLDRKISANASQLDNHFGQSAGSEVKTMGFAGKLNRLTDSNFNTSSTIASKGIRSNVGWQLQVQSNGTLRFEQKRSNGSSWQLTVPGFYGVGDLVLGTLTYDGGNANGSGFFRLFNGSEFVTVGSVSLGTASGTSDDSALPLIIGNVLDPSNPDANAPFEGPLFGLWFTRPGSSSFDESYLSRWIS